MGRESRLNPFGRDTEVPPVVLDIFGRALAAGDLVTINVAYPIAFAVKEVAPLEEPGVAPGQMVVTLSAFLKFAAPRGLPQQEFTRIMATSERNLPKAEEPPPPPHEPADPPIEEPPPLGEPTRDEPDGSSVRPFRGKIVIPEPTKAEPEGV